MATPVKQKDVNRPGRIRSGWLLAKMSWRVLMLDKELIVFPLLSGLSCLLILAGFAGGIWASGVGQQESEPVNQSVAVAVMFAWYFLNFFVIVFFNAALIACAIIRFKGGDPTVGDGMRAAGERIAQITAWALVASTVGMLLRIIEDRMEFVGRIMAGLLGAAWTIATFLVVPVLVVEKIGPIDAFKRSTEIIRKTWGESLVSNIGIGVIAVLVSMLILIGGGIGVGMLYTQTQSLVVLVAGIGTIVALLILVSLASSALSSIVLSALYLYAAEGKMPQAFQAAGAEGAFVSK